MDELKNKIHELENRIKKIDEWIAMRDRQQLQLPLDEGTQNIINRYQTF